MVVTAVTGEGTDEGKTGGGMEQKVENRIGNRLIRARSHYLFGANMAFYLGPPHIVRVEFFRPNG